MSNTVSTIYKYDQHTLTHKQTHSNSKLITMISKQSYMKKYTYA